MNAVVETKQVAPQPTGQGQAVSRVPQTGVARPLNLTRAQKAAVVIAMLGEAEARPIVERLDDRTMSQVATALETISTLGRDQLAEIAVDFLRELRAASGSFSGGQDKAREIIANILDQNRYQQIYGAPEAEDGAEQTAETSDTWVRLEKYDPQLVADYFQSLTPNIMALILRKLDVAAASEIVRFLDDSLLDPVMGHLVEDEAPDPEIYTVLAHMIDLELLNTPAGPAGAEDTSHLEVIGEMLSLVPSERRDRILSFLNTSHESKLKSIEKVMFTIDSLPEIMAREMVPIVFRELGEDVMIRLLASLQGRNAEISDYLLSNISSRLADQYRLQLEDEAEMTVEKAEKVQREFLMSLMSMKRDGTIKIGKPEED
jgi:flagellar motor switch protein FliG